MTLVIITAGIDLTVGSTLAIVIVSVGNFLVMGLNPFAAVLAGAAIGFCLGLVNGILVAKMKLQPYVATLGMMSVYRGVAYLITGGWPVLNIPQNFRDIMDGDVIGTLSSSMILFLVVTVIAYILLKHTKFGTYLYSIGSNEEATRLSGVNVDFNKLCLMQSAVSALRLPEWSCWRNWAPESRRPEPAMRPMPLRLRPLEAPAWQAVKEAS